MRSPTHGDLLVRSDNGGFYIVEAVTGKRLDGPFHELDHAVGIAHSLATKQNVNVWRETTDDRGASFGPPQLVHRGKNATRVRR